MTTIHPKCVYRKQAARHDNRIRHIHNWSSVPSLMYACYLEIPEAYLVRYLDKTITKLTNQNTSLIAPNQPLGNLGKLLQLIPNQC